MDDVEILRPESGGSQVQNISPALLCCVLREEISTAFSEAKVLRPNLTPIKWCFISGPHCSVILLFSPSCSSQMAQKEFEMESGTFRINIRGQMSVHMESIRRETNKDLT